jgi:hypothetical protein
MLSIEASQVKIDALEQAKERLRRAEEPNGPTSSIQKAS